MTPTATTDPCHRAAQRFNAGLASIRPVFQFPDDSFLKEQIRLSRNATEQTTSRCTIWYDTRGPG